MEVRKVEKGNRNGYIPFEEFLNDQNIDHIVKEKFLSLQGYYYLSNSSKKNKEYKGLGYKTAHLRLNYETEDNKFAYAHFVISNNNLYFSERVTKGPIREDKISKSIYNTLQNSSENKIEKFDRSTILITEKNVHFIVKNLLLKAISLTDTDSISIERDYIKHIYEANSNEFSIGDIDRRKPEIKQTIIERYSRNPSHARRVLESVGFICQVDNSHVTFPAKKNKKNFVEAHHLIPMKYQGDERFQSSLDVPENIVSLCPNCHKAVHYGDTETRENILKKLFAIKKLEMEKNNIFITIDKLINFYD